MGLGFGEEANAIWGYRKKTFLKTLGPGAADHGGCHETHAPGRASSTASGDHVVAASDGPHGDRVPSRGYQRRLARFLVVPSSRSTSEPERSRWTAAEALGPRLRECVLPQMPTRLST